MQFRRWIDLVLCGCAGLACLRTGHAQIVFGLDRGSPSLVVGPYTDASVLIAGQAPSATTPELHLVPPLGTDLIDDFSGNAPPPQGNPVRLAFSVDRETSGAVGTAVFAQFNLHQQPADVFSSQLAFPDPLSVLLPPGIGYVGNLSSTPIGGNVLTLDESQLSLTATGTPGALIPADAVAPPIAPGTHDNVDALYFKPFDLSGDFLPDVRFYFTVHRDQPALNPAFQSAADIYWVDEQPLPRLFAPAQSLGLDQFGVNSDDVDALLVFDVGIAGMWEPGVDRVLFSLSPGSASLEGFNLSAADVLISDLSHRFATYATACALGLSDDCDLTGPGQGSDGLRSDGLQPPANLDALGWAGILGDMNISGDITRADVPDFAQGLIDPVGYYFSHFGLPPSFLGDMNSDTWHDFDDISSFADTVRQFDPLWVGVPEPRSPAVTWFATCVCLWLGAANLGGRHSSQAKPAVDTRDTI